MSSALASFATSGLRVYLENPEFFEADEGCFRAAPVSRQRSRIVLKRMRAAAAARLQGSCKRCIAAGYGVITRRGFFVFRKSEGARGPPRPGEKGGIGKPAGFSRGRRPSSSVGKVGMGTKTTRQGPLYRSPCGTARSDAKDSAFSFEVLQSSLNR
jgi:hypothetical protein